MAKTAGLTTVDKLKHGISLNTYLPFSDLDIKDALERIAQEQGRSVSEITVLALREFVTKNPPKQKQK